MQETTIVNVSHIAHHNGSTEKDQQITSRAEVEENRHESRCNSPINLVRIMSALDTVVNVQFPSLMLPSFRVRLLLLTQSLISPPASAWEERNVPMRILAGGCRPAHPLFRGDSLRALNRPPFPVCFTKRVWQQLIVARHKNTARKARCYAPRCSALGPPRHRPSQTHTSNTWPALCATRRRRHD